MGAKVWASSQSSGLIVCPDGAGEDPDPARGDPDWDFGTNFEKLQFLPQKLDDVKGPISRLALCAHGAPGMIDLDSVFTSQNTLTQSASGSADTDFDDKVRKCLTLDTVDQFKPALQEIGRRIEDGGSITFMACNMAAGAMGGNLLKVLSKDIWPKLHVVGFTRIGTIVSKLGLKSCRLPGLKFGVDNTAPSSSQAQQDGRVQVLAKEPWADASSPVAKIARQGILTKDNEIVDWTPYLVGTWMFEVPGAPASIVRFEADESGRFFGGRCTWLQNLTPSGKKKTGFWSSIGDSNFIFLFGEDPKGREYHFRLDGVSLTGQVKDMKVTKGQFKLWTTRNL
jgi:hypothetical protein